MGSISRFLRYISLEPNQLNYKDCKSKKLKLKIFHLLFFSFFFTTRLFMHIFYTRKRVLNRKVTSEIFNSIINSCSKKSISIFIINKNNNLTKKNTSHSSTRQLFQSNYKYIKSIFDFVSIRNI